MCGRFSNDKTENALIEAFVAEGGDWRDWEPRYSIAPHSHPPIIREWHDEDGQHRILDRAEWGFAPAWAKSGGPRPINARLETVASNRMFAGAFSSQRAIVPMTGYFEWVELDGGKQPYFIHSESAELVAAAGLYAGKKDDATGEWTHSFTIITREARDAGGEVHDRMPVFLEPEHWDEWLSPDKLTDKESMHGLLDLTSERMASTMRTYPVARKVNSVRALDPTDKTLIEQVTL